MEDLRNSLLPDCWLHLSEIEFSSFLNNEQRSMKIRPGSYKIDPYLPFMTDLLHLRKYVCRDQVYHPWFVRFLKDESIHGLQTEGMKHIKYPVYRYDYTVGAIIIEFSEDGIPLTFFVTTATDYSPVEQCKSGWKDSLKSIIEQLNIRYLYTVGDETFNEIIHLSLTMEKLFIFVDNQSYKFPCICCPSYKCMITKAKLCVSINSWKSHIITCVDMIPKNLNLIQDFDYIFIQESQFILQSIIQNDQNNLFHQKDYPINTQDDIYQFLKMM